MLLSIRLYLSGNLLFLCFWVLGAGLLLGVHAIHDLDDTIPCVFTINYGFWFEHNSIVFNRGFQNITYNSITPT
jgi:hypothetical protein